MKIHYRSGYKYQLAEDYEQHPLPDWFRWLEPVHHRYFEILTGQKFPALNVKGGYAWDGPSGPTIDDRHGMRPSLVHDVFYQALREGMLPANLYLDGQEPIDLRYWADYELWRLARQDGMNPIRARLWFWAVRKFGPRAVVDGGSKPLHSAP